MFKLKFAQMHFIMSKMIALVVAESVTPKNLKTLIEREGDSVIRYYRYEIHIGLFSL